jgi:hypothetical protein
VSALPQELARANVEEELVGARAWAGRHGWLIEWLPDSLQLRAATYHRPVHSLVEVIAELDGYRAVPPAWKFVRPGTNEIDRAYFPAAGGESIFHSNIVLCAPWNRLAYADHGGPHGNWPMTTWLQVQEGTRAEHVADMLAVIDVHLRKSPGFIA